MGRGDRTFYCHCLQIYLSQYEMVGRTGLFNGCCVVGDFYVRLGRFHELQSSCYVETLASSKKERSSG